MDEKLRSDLRQGNDASTLYATAKELLRIGHREEARDTFIRALLIPDCDKDVAKHMRREFSSVPAYLEVIMQAEAQKYARDSVAELRAQGYARPPRPVEMMSLIIDGLEGRLTDTPYQAIYEDMIKKRELASCGIEVRASKAIIDHEWRDVHFVQLVENHFSFVDLPQFGEEYRMGDTPTSRFLPIERLPKELVLRLYGLPLTGIPSPLKRGWGRAKVGLPPAGGVYKMTRGYQQKINAPFSFSYVGSQSGGEIFVRGVRERWPR